MLGARDSSERMRLSTSWYREFSAVGGEALLYLQAGGAGTNLCVIKQYGTVCARDSNVNFLLSICFGITIVL